MQCSKSKVSASAVLCILFVLPDVAAAQPDVSEYVKIIEESYKANQSAFTHGKCRFTYSYLSAASDDDALAGKWLSDGRHATAECTLYFRGDEMALRMPIENDSLVASLENADVLITPINIVRRGRFAIDHDGIVNNAVVHSPNSFTLNVRMHPFNFAEDSDGAGPASAIEYARLNPSLGISFTVMEAVERNGTQMLLLRKLSPLSDTTNSLNVDFYLDPDRGYLPIEKEYFSKRTGESKYREFLLDVREHEGAFFPMHAIHLMNRRPSGREPYVDVREMKVLELDLDYVPTDEDLTIYLPKHTQFSDGINPNTAKSLFRDQDADFAAVSVNDIERIYNELQDLAKERERQEAAIAAGSVMPPSRRSTVVILISINAAIAAILVAIAIYRRRKGGDAGPQN